MKFRKKPVVIEAVLWDGDNLHGVLRFGGDSITMDTHKNLYIQTLEGRMKADHGDWIIRGVKGEFYPCKPDIFAITYDPVEEG